MPDRFFPASDTLLVADAAEVAEAVAGAHADRRPIYPVGGGTSLGLGASVDEPGTIVSLAKLNRLVDYPARDLTVTVEAGMTMAELARCLAAENQRLPIDVGISKTATVGGVVAADLSGPRRYRFGTMRDYVLGLSAVDGTGKIFSTGGRVVKNAAGYDLTRLMIGSLGSLGVVTQITLMVRPLPEMSAFAAIPLPSFEQADALLEALATSDVEATAIELVAGADLPKSPDPETPATLWIGHESSEIEVRYMLDAIAGLCRDLGLEAVSTELPEPVNAIWQALSEQATFLADDRRDATLAVEVTVLPSRTIAAVERLRKIDQDVSVHCHGGNGVLHGRFDCDPGRAGPLAAEIREAAVELGGRAVVTAFPRESRLDRQMVWGAPGGDMRVMQRIKQEFDPEGILNRGRFIFEQPTASVPT